MLIQFSSNEETRTYTDCRTPADAMETLVRIFENFLYNKDATKLAVCGSEPTIKIYDEEKRCVDLRLGGE